MNVFLKCALVVATCISLVACGSNKRSFAVNVQSDPLGAYALMQVKYKGDEDPEWIYLGPTPVVLDKSVRFDGATTVSLKVIRPGFFEQVKTWKARDFVKEHKKYKKITWVPNLVKQ